MPSPDLKPMLRRVGTAALSHMSDAAVLSDSWNALQIAMSAQRGALAGVQSTSVVQGHAVSPAETDGAARAPDARPRCPECMTLFERRHPLQLFCVPTHRDEWNARTFVRARVVLPLIMVGRITRDGTRGDKDTGNRASAEANILLQRYRDEDRTAGRMEWPEYLRLRYLCGFDPI